MSTFRVGQKVVLVHPSQFDPMPAGSIVVISAINTCSCCGLEAIAFKDSIFEYACFCKTKAPTGFQWWQANRFRPIQEQSVSAKLAQEHVERIVEERPEHINEPVEA